MDKLRVGIAGYGIVGQRRRVHIDLRPDMSVTAVCDAKFGGSGDLPDGVKYFPDYRALLDEPLDALFVCLPNYLAAAVTVAGLERGMHVFCEKPPGKTVSEVRKVIEVEKSRPGLVLKYGFNHRYHDSVREALRIKESMTMGRIINLRGVYGKSKIIPFEGGWRAERKYSGGGILLDQGIHMLDIMRLFCSDFVEVKSYVSNGFWHHDVEDNAYALLRDRDGTIAMLHSSATQWQHRFSLDIAFAEGYLVLSGILSGTKSYGEERLIIGRRNESDTGSNREETITFLSDNSWRDEIGEFADAVVNKSAIVNGTSSDALETMKMVCRIYGADPDWRRMFNLTEEGEGE